MDFENQGEFLSYWLYIKSQYLPVAGCGFFRMSSIEYKRNPLTIHMIINDAMDDNTTNVITI